MAEKAPIDAPADDSHGDRATGYTPQVAEEAVAFGGAETEGAVIQVARNDLPMGWPTKGVPPLSTAHQAQPFQTTKTAPAELAHVSPPVTASAGDKPVSPTKLSQAQSREPAALKLAIETPPRVKETEKAPMHDEQAATPAEADVHEFFLLLSYHIAVIQKVRVINHLSALKTQWVLNAVTFFCCTCATYLPPTHRWWRPAAGSPSPTSA